MRLRFASGANRDYMEAIIEFRDLGLDDLIDVALERDGRDRRCAGLVREAV